MDTTKLLEALTDLRDKRDVINQAILSLESALRVIDGGQQQPFFSGSLGVSAVARRSRSGKSYIDHAVDILSTVDQMRIEDLLRRIVAIVGHPVSRGTVDGSISREIRERGNASRFERVAPGVYRVRKRDDALPSVA